MDTTKLKALCWQYIDVIQHSLTEESHLKRRALHNQILDITELSAFEFGGLPFWYEITNVDEAATRLYEALIAQIKAKQEFVPSTE